MIKNLIKKKNYSLKQKKNWDKRSKIEIYNDLKYYNDRVVVEVPPGHYLYRNLHIFPMSGISNSSTIHCNENGYYSIYKSDRYGFNNPNSEWDKEKIDYVLVGDSFVQGACVNRPDDISSVLRKISKGSILNLGLGGNGPLIEYITLREYLPSNSKKILWFYYSGNDLVNLEVEYKNKLLNKYLDNPNFTQNLKHKQNEIDNLALNIIEEMEQRSKNINKNKNNKIKEKKIKLYLINLKSFIFLSHTRKLLHRVNDEKNLIMHFKKIVKLTKKLAEINNSKLYFIYLPQYAQFKLDYQDKNYNAIKNIVNELNIPFIDISKEVFEKEANPLKLFPFELNGHYNVEGYKKVSEAIYKLTKN